MRLRWLRLHLWQRAFLVLSISTTVTGLTPWFEGTDSCELFLEEGYVTDYRL